MARITVFEVGFCTHPGCVALRGASLAACAFPARAYLIEAHGRRWLWDTGYATHFYDHTKAGVFALYRKITPVHFDASSALAAQLAHRGLRPHDLTALIVSHFHGDHIAGLRDFPGLGVMCSGSGWQSTRRLRGFAALRRGFVPGLIPEDFESRLTFIEAFTRAQLPSDLSPFITAFTLPGSQGEVQIVELPGHSAGHLGVFVQTDEGWVLIASDAAWSPQSYIDLTGPSRIAHWILEDVHAYYGTLEALNRLHRGGHAKILLTHEGAL
jgi:glyoxylase-like metal-dependent hydrolase (beta-lactamase superfamily II)